MQVTSQNALSPKLGHISAPIHGVAVCQVGVRGVGSTLDKLRNRIRQISRQLASAL